MSRPPHRSGRPKIGAVRKMLVENPGPFRSSPRECWRRIPAYGSADMLGWLVEEQGIEPHIPVFDKSERKDGAFPATDFVYDHDGRRISMPRRAGAEAILAEHLGRGDQSSARTASRSTSPGNRIVLPASLKPRCTPNQATRKISRSRHESARQKARDIARTDAYVTSSYARKKVEMLFAHLKRIIGLDRLRLRGPNGAKDEFHLAATVQNLRKLAKMRRRSRSDGPNGFAPCKPLQSLFGRLRAAAQEQVCTSSILTVAPAARGNARQAVIRRR